MAKEEYESGKSGNFIENSLFRNKQYTRGVLAQVFYVGSQIMCWTYIYHYCESIGINNSEAAKSIKE